MAVHTREYPGTGIFVHQVGGYRFKTGTRLVTPLMFTGLQPRTSGYCTVCLDIVCQASGTEACNTNNGVAEERVSLLVEYARVASPRQTRKKLEPKKYILVPADNSRIYQTKMFRSRGRAADEMCYLGMPRTNVWRE